MNTIPDDETLALWVEDELDATALANVDVWAATQPEWLQRREQARRIKALLQSALPAVEEPPYAEFFNARIVREISRGGASSVPSPEPAAISPGRIRNWFLPATAVAGMIFCFWAGTRVTPDSSIADHPPSSVAYELVPVMYTPEKGVSADWFSSEPADAMVIVLDGVAAIPDSFELSDTASLPARPASSTAEIEPQNR